MGKDERGDLPIIGRQVTRFLVSMRTWLVRRGYEFTDEQHLMLDELHELVHGREAEVGNEKLWWKW